MFLGNWLAMRAQITNRRLSTIARFASGRHLTLMPRTGYAAPLTFRDAASGLEKVSI